MLTCIPFSEDFIAVQRQLIAQQVLQEKGLSVALQSRTLTSTTKRAPLQPLTSPSHGNQYRSNRQRKVAKPVPQQLEMSPYKKGSYHNNAVGGDDHSISTATMTTMSHEPAPPLHLPTFKPAIGCISASDFIVRCFVARLRSGVTVVKHGRTKFKKSSRLCTLKIDRDGQSLIWLPAHPNPGSSQILPESQSESVRSSSRSKRLNLSECKEVRMALTPDPKKPAYTGSAVLREKCEAADAHKSFALIFEHRTLDITSMTADQCTMLAQGFSALCYHLHLKRNYRRFHSPPEEATRRGCFRL